PGVVTVMLLAPAVAVRAITRVAVICVSLTTVTPVAVMPAGTLREVAPVRLTPGRVTGTLAAWKPEAGVVLGSTGTGGTAVKGSALLVPPVVVTEIGCAPVGAVAAMARVAEMLVAVMTGVPLTVTPTGRFRVEPSRLEPVRVTATLAPCAPVAGTMLVSTG